MKNILLLLLCVFFVGACDLEVSSENRNFSQYAPIVEEEPDHIFGNLTNNIRDVISEFIVKTRVENFNAKAPIIKNGLGFAHINYLMNRKFLVFFKSENVEKGKVISLDLMLKKSDTDYIHYFNDTDSIEILLKSSSSNNYINVDNIEKIILSMNLSEISIKEKSVAEFFVFEK